MILKNMLISNNILSFNQMLVLDNDKKNGELQNE